MTASRSQPLNHHHDDHGDDDGDHDCDVDDHHDDRDHDGDGDDLHDNGGEYDGLDSHGDCNEDLRPPHFS